MSEAASDLVKLVVAVGLPGSGKSAYFAAVGANAVSSDTIRLWLADDAGAQSVNGRVFALARYVVRERLELGRPVTYVDATNLTRRERRVWIEMGRAMGCRVEALWFDVPYAVCRVRNGARGRVVPEHAMELMAARFVPPSVEEGFDGVVVAVGGVTAP